MGNKQTSKKDTKQSQQPKPRNIFSLYGPKPIDNSSANLSQFTSQDTSIDPSLSSRIDEEDKIILRLSRANKCHREDGLQCHSSVESLSSSLRFISQFVDLVSSEKINLKWFEENQLKEIVNINEKEDEGAFKTDELITKQFSKQEIEQILLGNSQSNEEQDDDADIDLVRPTAYFSGGVQDHSFPKFSISKRDTFGEGTGLPQFQQNNKESIEDSQFAPSRQTANFGDLPVKQQPLQQFMRQQDSFQYNGIFQEQIKEEEESKFEQESYQEEQEGEWKYLGNNLDQQLREDVKCGKKEDQEDEQEEPIYLKIDLTAALQKKKTNQKQEKKCEESNSSPISTNKLNSVKQQNSPSNISQQSKEITYTSIKQEKQNKISKVNETISDSLLKNNQTSSSKSPSRNQNERVNAFKQSQSTFHAGSYSKSPIKNIQKREEEPKKMNKSHSFTLIKGSNKKLTESEKEQNEKIKNLGADKRAIKQTEPLISLEKDNSILDQSFKSQVEDLDNKMEVIMKEIKGDLSNLIKSKSKTPKKNEQQ